ncbi:MAG TPA: DUF2490 domain-containing protein [Pyrinomonadaceae bacterium]|nr:DUF2490 domain-containing protein [Pyrinomonadaceae bacterium]
MNIKLLLISLFSLFLFSQTFFPQPPLPSKFQSWNEVQLIVPVSRKKDSKGKTVDTVTATFTGILRIGRKNWDFIDNRYGVTLDFRVNKFLTLMTGALYRKDELVINRRNYETRLDFGFVASKTWKKITFKNRNMYEHRFRNSRTDTNLYRNRINISYPIKYKEKELFSPFVTDEGYFDLKTKKWTQNEFFAGITRKLTPKISLDLAYIRNDSSPTNVNGFSTSLKIKLR